MLAMACYLLDQEYVIPLALVFHQSRTCPTFQTSSKTITIKKEYYSPNAVQLDQSEVILVSAQVLYSISNPVSVTFVGTTLMRLLAVLSPSIPVSEIITLGGIT